MDQNISYHAIQTLPESTQSACIAIGIYKSRKLTAAAEQIDKACKGYLRALLKEGDFNADIGETQLLYGLPNVQAKRILLVGCGQAGKISLADYRHIHAAFARKAVHLKTSEAISFLTEIEVSDLEKTARLQHAVLAAEDAIYRFEQYKTDPVGKFKLKKISFAQADGKQLAQHSVAVSQAAAIAKGTALAKTLGNLPANVCTPSYLAKQARALQRDFKSVKTNVLDETAMKKLGMNALLSVGRGSREPARLIVMEYMHGKKTDKPVVLVGKGITFDTGGISIKPSLGMDEMKFDMCGAASVLGVIKACAQMQLKANVIGVIAGAENMPGGNATKPGDIVKSYSGKTIEILNTDAEGRLVLCDALTYIERFKPGAVIDIATLTGACIVALGRLPSGLLGNNQKLIDQLIKAGEQSGDRVWQLPLWPEYRKQLKSNFADLANIGGPEAGTITAASFLSHFTEAYPWAHLDIAGTAWRTGKQKGATGRPVQLLMQYILMQHAQSVKA
ncbi:MAG: leucyl aminopeptidase [Gammaproteobacteria bacterium]|nr:leucyl aminopeptidase [Gammaproteobacteria bacterium]